VTEEMTYIYKIRRKSDGKFWTPGWVKNWNGVGKAYVKLGFAKNAFNNHGMNRDEVEIVQFQTSAHGEVVSW
jgi:hypothetical protein